MLSDQGDLEVTRASCHAQYSTEKAEKEVEGSVPQLKGDWSLEGRGAQLHIE